jgi:hypothetical protein
MCAPHSPSGLTLPSQAEEICMTFRDRVLRGAAVLATTCLSGAALAEGAPKPSSFKPHANDAVARIALIGDVPYRDPDILKLDEVIREINAAPVDITIHTGDIKSGSSLCADELLQARFDQLRTLKRPLVYTPGDNEWTDCHRPAAGAFNPLERLAKLRALFFPQPQLSLGKQPMRVRSQAADAAHAEFVENVRFVRADVVFATLHVVGSNNGLALWAGIGETAAAPLQERLDEVARRTAATLAWIDASFDEAEQRGSAGVLFAMQADPNLELVKGDPARQGFEEILAKLSERSVRFARPVLVAHGDSHFFRFDKPLFGKTVSQGEQRLEDFSRVENFGDLDVHWVEIRVDARTPEVFQAIPHIVDANRFER